MLCHSSSRRSRPPPSGKWGIEPRINIRQVVRKSALLFFIVAKSGAEGVLSVVIRVVEAFAKRFIFVLVLLRRAPAIIVVSPAATCAPPVLGPVTSIHALIR